MNAPEQSEIEQDHGWTPVCESTDIPYEQGVAALVKGVQIAVFRTHLDEFFAVDNRDPFTGANVLARGIVGTRGALQTVASPLHKQVFDLATGVCLDDPAVSVRTYPVRIVADRVHISVPTSIGPPIPAETPANPSSSAAAGTPTAGTAR